MFSAQPAKSRRLLKGFGLSPSYLTEPTGRFSLGGKFGGPYTCGATFPYIVPLSNIFLTHLFSKTRLRSKAFGSTPETWLHMQLAYDLAAARKDESKIKVRRQHLVELHA
jgi:hypothetical protein